MPGPVVHERRYLSQYSIQTLGVVVHVEGVPADADGAVTATFVQIDVTPNVTVFSRAATNPATGVYEITTSSGETDVPGQYELRWTFQVNAIAQTIIGYVEVGEASPEYDALNSDYKMMVERVWAMFADAFDSPWGGPHLQVYFQANYGRGRMTQLLGSALTWVNLSRQPMMNYDFVNKPFPPAYGGILEKALEVETIKHLMRSYVEQPAPQAVGVAYLDRRDYLNRWETMLALAKDDLKMMLDTFKISQMGLGRPRVLVAGGVFGDSGPSRNAFHDPARPHYWAYYG